MASEDGEIFIKVRISGRGLSAGYRLPVSEQDLMRITRT